MYKKTAIVTGGTANDVPAMACLVMNIKDTNPNLADEIVIYHNGISNKDQALINGIFPTRFIFYKSPFTDVKDFGDVVTKYFSTMVFCKYECFKLLDEYECVIWTDYDVVIVDDLLPLIQNLQSTCAFMDELDNYALKEMFTHRIWRHDIVHTVNLDKLGICLPLFVLKNTLTDYKKIYQRCIDLTKELAHYLYLPEQAVLGIVLQEYNVMYDNIPYRQYCCHPVTGAFDESVKILHAYGPKKFWNGINNETWDMYYKKWITYGGTPYKHRTTMGKVKKVFTLLYQKCIRYILPYGFVRFIDKLKG